MIDLSFYGTFLVMSFALPWTLAAFVSLKEIKLLVRELAFGIASENTTYGCPICRQANS